MKHGANNRTLLISLLCIIILENVIIASQITCKKRQNFAKNSSSSCTSFAVQPVLQPKYEKSFTPNPLYGSKIREHIYVWNGWLDLGKNFKTSARNQSDARNINPLSDDLRNYLRQRKVLKDTHYVTSNTQRTLRTITEIRSFSRLSFTDIGIKFCELL